MMTNADSTARFVYDFNSFAEFTSLEVCYVGIYEEIDSFLSGFLYTLFY